MFRVMSNMPLVRVSGCVAFGGSITVDVTLLPKNISNITLMTFNCSTGNFNFISSNCSHQLEYLAHSLVLNLDINNCQKGDLPKSYFWILWIVIGLTAIVIVILAIYITKTRKNLEEFMANAGKKFVS